MTTSTRRLRVVAALITSNDGQRVLIQQRPPGKARALLWEFPGGKVEPDESDEGALRREVREELGVELEVGAERFQTFHTYADVEVDLHVYRARVMGGTPRSQAGQVLREVNLTELAALPFCEADRPLVDAILRGTSEVPGKLGE
jgi:8-oxo-dGTP diphosphatase